MLVSKSRMLSIVDKSRYFVGYEKLVEKHANC